MTFKELLSQYKNSQRAYETLFHLSKKIKSLQDYITHRKEEIDFKEEDFHFHLNSSLPLERLTKKVFFYGYEFELLEQVFCPRHETETLIEVLKDKEPLKGTYIDLCSGTGIIGITLLKRNPQLEASLLDISEQAIENIRLNIEKHSVKAKVIKDDWLNHLQKNDYSIITANFPYVGDEDPIDDQLTNNEPQIALFAENNGWEHYDKLLKHMKNNDKWELVVLECNSLHQTLWNEAESNYRDFEFKYYKDINNLLRVALITRTT